MVLLGIVPVLMHTPPTALCFSTSATRFSRLDRLDPRTLPAGA